MIKIAGIWEIGINTPLIEHDQWDYPLCEYDVDEWIMTPVSGIDGKCVEYHTIQDAIDDNPDLTVVYVDEKGSEELHNFKHPNDALYIFGRSSQSHMDPKGITLRIDTLNNGGRLWAHQAACLVLDHRFRNGNNSNRSESNT
jgi:hypothetical protein